MTRTHPAPATASALRCTVAHGRGGGGGQRPMVVRLLPLRGVVRRARVSLARAPIQSHAHARDDLT